MTALANSRNIKRFMKKIKSDEKLNILTLATHERYEENLCKTGHNFYSLKYGKEWDTTYAPVPDNYHIINRLDPYLDIDLVLSHTSCNRLQVVHDALSQTKGKMGMLNIPILRHCHVLPDIRFNTDEEIKMFKEIPVDHTSFISNYNRDVWGFSEDSASVVEHGVDTDFWCNGEEWLHYPRVLSVVNDLPNRDWCCGFELWKSVVHDLPYQIVGKCTGEHVNFSQPAQTRTELREYYRQSSIFLNTSLHSPVPTVLLEAMACGCAIVSTDNCMIPDIIQHGKNGLLSNDPKQLNAYCQVLLQNPEMAKKLGLNARKTIVEKYNLQNFVDNWNNLLYSTVNNYCA